MSRLVRSQSAFLNLLYSTSDLQRKALLKTITTKQLNALCEIIYNIYKRTVKLSQYFVKKLVPFKAEILTLINKRVSEAKKKATLIKLRTILPIVLKPVLSLINNGTRANIDGKREIPGSNEILSGNEGQGQSTDP